MRKTKFSTAFRIGCISIIGLVIIQVFINPIAFIANLVTINEIRSNLPSAKARWQFNQVASYKIDVHGFVPLLCFYDARLTVQQGQLISVEIREDILDETFLLVPLESGKWDDKFGCSYSDLTVESMFKRVEQSLHINTWDASLEVVFDEQYGFVSDYEVSSGYRVGQ